MIVRRSVFFFALFLLVTVPFLSHKILWVLRSQKATGTMGFIGKTYTGQIPHWYSVILFQVGNDSFWLRSTDNIIFNPNEKMPILYQPKNPFDAHTTVFADLWGDTLVYAGIPAMLVLIVCFHPHIVPYRNNIQLVRKKPFIKIV